MPFQLANIAWDQLQQTMQKAIDDYDNNNSNHNNNVDPRVRLNSKLIQDFMKLHDYRTSNQRQQQVTFEFEKIASTSTSTSTSASTSLTPIITSTTFAKKINNNSNSNSNHIQSFQNKVLIQKLNKTKEKVQRGLKKIPVNFDSPSQQFKNINVSDNSTIILSRTNKQNETLVTKLVNLMTTTEIAAATTTLNNQKQIQQSFNSIDQNLDQESIIIIKNNNITIQKEQQQPESSSPVTVVTESIVEPTVIIF